MVLVLAFYAVSIGIRGVGLLGSGSVVGVLLGRRPARPAAARPAPGVARDRVRPTHRRAGRDPGGGGRAAGRRPPAPPVRRVDRGAADAQFQQMREQTEARPDDWRSWFRLALAYDAAGDRTRAREAARHALALHGLTRHTQTRIFGMSRPTASRVTVPTDAGPMPALLWVPVRSGPGLLLLQEIFGVSDYIQAPRRRPRRGGYVVLAPELYWRLDADADRRVRRRGDRGGAWAARSSSTGPRPSPDAVAALRAAARPARSRRHRGDRLLLRRRPAFNVARSRDPGRAGQLLRLRAPRTARPRAAGDRAEPAPLRHSPTPTSTGHRGEDPRRPSPRPRAPSSSSSTTGADHAFDNDDFVLHHAGGVAARLAADPGVPGARAPRRMSTYFVGVDLAWGERKPTGLAVLDDDGHLVHVSAPPTDEAIVRGPGAVRRRATAWSPSTRRWWSQRDRQPALRGRAQPRLRPVRRRRAPVQHRASRSSPTEPRGARLARRARTSTSTRGRGRARRAIEVYPHPATVALFRLGRTLKYKNKPGPQPRRSSATSCSRWSATSRACADAPTPLHLDRPRAVARAGRRGSRRPARKATCAAPRTRSTPWSAPTSRCSPSASRS